MWRILRQALRASSCSQRPLMRSISARRAARFPASTATASSASSFCVSASVSRPAARSEPGSRSRGRASTCTALESCLQILLLAESGRCHRKAAASGTSSFRVSAFESQLAACAASGMMPCGGGSLSARTTTALMSALYHWNMLLHVSTGEWRDTGDTHVIQVCPIGLWTGGRASAASASTALRTAAIARCAGSPAAHPLAPSTPGPPGAPAAPPGLPGSPPAHAPSPATAAAPPGGGCAAVCGCRPPSPRCKSPRVIWEN